MEDVSKRYLTKAQQNILDFMQTSGCVIIEERADHNLKYHLAKVSADIPYSEDYRDTRGRHGIQKATVFALLANNCIREIQVWPNQTTSIFEANR